MWVRGDLAAALPLHAVVQCHLAGGHRSTDGEWIDSHAFPVPEPVWALFEEIVRRSPVRAAIVERDENLPAFAELAAEAARARISGVEPLPVEALAPFGLDPREKAFWQGGLHRLERLIDEFEALG